jgi:hypothetical protein
MRVLSVMAGLVVLLSGFGATTVFRSPEYGFSVNVPVTLVADGPEQLTTDAGKQYVATNFTGGFDNGDTYLVGVSDYPFPVAPDDMQRVIAGVASSFSGTVTNTQSLTVSGQPALRATITLPDKTRFAYLVSFKNNRVFQFSFGTMTGTAFDSPEVKTFFDSATIN